MGVQAVPDERHPCVRMPASASTPTGETERTLAFMPWSAVNRTSVSAGS